MTDLVITNGDSAGELLRRTLPGTEVLPWRDVLHEGPVPLTASLEELTAARAAYLAEAGGGDLKSIEFELSSRDRGLSVNAQFDKIILWFEHDLYDQLQLLQVLDWFARNLREPDTLFLVQVDDYIARVEPDAIPNEASLARPVTPEQLDIAMAAWTAFRQPTPEAWVSLLEEDRLGRDLSALPFLRSALHRMLEELPGPDGLTRTERQILVCLRSAANLTALDLFQTVQKQEDAEFMGDWSFWRVLDGLALGAQPAIAGLEGAPFQFADKDRMKAYVASHPALTSLGKSVLSGEADWAEHHKIDRWWGGTHLTSANLWRWDAESEHLIAPL